jgi:hypothetical protein
LSHELCVASADDAFDDPYDDAAENFNNNNDDINSGSNSVMLEEVDSGIVLTEYHFTENNKEFSVQNIVRRPGCETFVIDFSDGGDRRRPPPRRCHGLQRSQSALEPQLVVVGDNKNAKTKGNKRKKREPIKTEEAAARRGPTRIETAARREPIMKEAAAARREPIRKEEKNEINKSLRNSRQG